MIKSIIYWIIMIGIVVGGILAECPLNGTIGIAGLVSIASSFTSRKDNGVDSRFKFRWKRFFIGLACLGAAVAITVLEL